MSEKTKQRSVEKEIQKFCGWRKIREWIEKADKKVQKGLIIVLFKTGCRISEALGTDRTPPLNRSFFEFGDTWFIGQNIPVLKKYEKVSQDYSKKKYECEYCGERFEEKKEKECPADETFYHKYKTIFPHWETEAKKASRDIRWPASEPLNDLFEEFCRSFDWKEPFFQYNGRRMKRAYAYKLIKSVDEELWPHRLRAERASQLGEEYHFDEMVLKEWFNWDTDDIPDQYVGPGRIMKDMMINRTEKLEERWKEQGVK